jgi:hypothetical protein
VHIFWRNLLPPFPGLFTLLTWGWRQQIPLKHLYPTYHTIYIYMYVYITLHPNRASCTMGTRSFLGVKQAGRGADHPPPSRTEVENEYSYSSTPPLGPWWPNRGWTLPLPYIPTDSDRNHSSVTINLPKFLIQLSVKFQGLISSTHISPIN